MAQLTLPSKSPRLHQMQEDLPDDNLAETKVEENIHVYQASLLIGRFLFDPVIFNYQFKDQGVELVFLFFIPSQEVL